MRTVRIAYEDQYYQEMDRLIRRLRNDAGMAATIQESISVRGTGGFSNEVPRLLRLPLKQTKRAADRLVCVADADRPANLVPAFRPAPGAGHPAEVDAWLVELETAWKARLVSQGALSDGDASRLFVVCLRWCKESILVACPDALVEFATTRERADEVAAVLDGCSPDPRALSDEEFVNYAAPAACMDRVLEAVEGRGYKKGRDDEDLLRDHISRVPGRRGEVMRRCPDFGRLLALLQ